MADNSHSKEESEDLTESPQIEDRVTPPVGSAAGQMSRTWERPRSAKRLGFHGLADLAEGDEGTMDTDRLRAGWKAALAREGKQYYSGQSIGERLRREREQREREKREREES